jgi:hypothetical protein
VNEPGKNDDEKGRDFSEFAQDRPAQYERSGGSRLLRGCGIALAIAFLVFAFVVGACFISYR